MEKKLPKGWVETKLGLIAEWGSGGTPNRNESKYYNGSIPWIKTGDLNDSIIFEASEFISELGLQKSSAKIFPKGSIIIAMYGATIGKTAVLGIDASTNQACGVAKAYKVVLPEFLHYYLKSEKQNFIEKGKGGAQPNISQTVIKEHPFPLPPLPVQHRIVAKLDTLFGHLDALKTRLDRIPQLLKTFRQSVLTQAVTGKLTEEWREGRELFVEIEEVKNYWLNQINLKSEKLESIFDNIEDELYPIPEQWTFCNLDKICLSFSYGSSEKSDNVGLIPVLRMGNLQSGKIDWKDLKYSSKKDEIKKYKLNSGDVLFNRTNSPELVGKTSIYRGEMPAIYAGYLIKIASIKEFLDPEFLNISLNTEFARSWCWSVKSDGVSQSNINAQKLSKFTISLPPLEEQQEIVRRVESLFAKADRIEAQYQSLKAKIEQLPQALLAKAFSGELVEQLPGDGDARELLEEIKKLKGETGKKERVKPTPEKERILRGAQDDTGLRQVAEPVGKYRKKN